MKNKKIKKTEPKKEKIKFDIAEETLAYYGFKIFPTPSISKEDRKDALFILKEGWEYESPCFDELSPEENISLLRFFEANSFPKDQPNLLAFSNRLAEKGKGKDRKLYLEIMGSSRNMSEAIVLHTIFEILREEKMDEDVVLKINSMGDKDSSLRFTKELKTFWKKNIDELSNTCKQAVRKNFLSPFCCNHEKCIKIRSGAPKSISTLSEIQREHFMGVLEYLETLEIPYEIDDSLFGNRMWCSQTIFKIFNKKEEIIAIGNRYNHLAKAIGFKRDLHSFGAKIILPAKSNEKIFYSKNLNPKICFVQLGQEAKNKSLSVLRKLREAKIPVIQSLSKDKIGSQLAVAENQKIPYLVIMGQREAITDSVIVRHNSTRSQETVRIEELANYLKKIK